MAVWTVFLLKMELSPHFLTAAIVSVGIRSLPGRGTIAGPNPNSALPPTGSLRR
jgi:hypothetical protein